MAFTDTKHPIVVQESQARNPATARGIRTVHVHCQPAARTCTSNCSLLHRLHGFHCLHGLHCLLHSLHGLHGFHRLHRWCVLSGSLHCPALHGLLHSLHRLHRWCVLRGCLHRAALHGLLPH